MFVYRRAVGRPKGQTDLPQPECREFILPDIPEENDVSRLAMQGLNFGGKISGVFLRIKPRHCHRKREAIARFDLRRKYMKYPRGQRPGRGQIELSQY